MLLQSLVRRGAAHAAATCTARQAGAAPRVCLAHGHLFTKSLPARHVGVYRKIWSMTAAYTQRRGYGWYLTQCKTAPWMMLWALVVPYYLWNWFSDEWKDVMSLGFRTIQFHHPDTNLSDYRNAKSIEFLKHYD